MSGSLTEKVKVFALQNAGFDLVGISSVNLPKVHEDALVQWIDRGYAGSMDYMARSQKKRARPEEILAGAKSVISLAINYYHPDDEKPVGCATGKVAKYAYGTDYHKVIEKKLKLLSQFILKEAGDGAQVKSYVDTGPILEKAFAQMSGLGFFGKNTNVITKNYGSWIFLANLITNLELEYDEPHMGSCGSCRICIDACPTDALLGNYQIDARRCISYLTIEAKENPPEDLKAQIGEWVFGCDICQDVCPYNHKPKITRHEELYPKKKAGTWLDLEAIQNIKEEDRFKEVFQESPLKRPKLSGLLRNSRIILENLSDRKVR